MKIVERHGRIGIHGSVGVWHILAFHSYASAMDQSPKSAYGQNAVLTFDSTDKCRASTIPPLGKGMPQTRIHMPNTSASQVFFKSSHGESMQEPYVGHFIQSFLLEI